MEKVGISYSFTFENGLKRVFDVGLDGKTLAFIPEKVVEPPLWARLNNNKCENCTLDVETNEYCPVAVNLSHIADRFKDFASHERVVVNVTTRERVYSKYTSLQEGLSSLIGIVMVTSGCPVMEYLRPIVRFHLPFATVAETVYRMVSMYVMSQYMLKRNGGVPDWELKGLDKIYTDVHQVNKDFSRRIAEIASNDANVNAIMNLDCFACLVPLTAGEMIEEMELSFRVYLRNLTPL